MKTSMTIEEFKKLMCIPFDASKNYIEQTFESIADVLMNGCVIKYLNDEFRILDFEFYFYNKNHQDISVHPRNSEALCWYINDFGGIDLNFESKIARDEKFPFKYKLTSDSYFGGILIRQIQRQSDHLLFDCPLKVAEIFRVLDATSQNQNNPVLKMMPLAPIDFKAPFIRHNLLGRKKDPKAKVDYNLQECFTDAPESIRHKLETELDIFSKSPYRYCWKSK
jgi:hypothetical protein